MATTPDPYDDLWAAVAAEDLKLSALVGTYRQLVAQYGDAQAVITLGGLLLEDWDRESLVALVQAMVVRIAAEG